MARIRSKHSNLLNYFIHDRRDLSPAYVASCEKFFKEISLKRQAASTKRQAASLEELDETVDWNKLIDTLKTE